jgi:putative thioredoxin
MTHDITDATFEKEVIEASKKMPVLVDFWASWCGPCRVLGPVVEKLAKEFDGKMKLAKISVEENQETAGKYNIMSIPAVKLFKGGKEVDGFIGAQPEEKIRAWLKQKL